MITKDNYKDNFVAVLLLCVMTLMNLTTNILQDLIAEFPLWLAIVLYVAQATFFVVALVLIIRTRDKNKKEA